MDFRVLSHAGLQVQTKDCEVLCDPWLIGSTYWRSWWNYPAVEPALVKSLRPDFIALTHIHWDHFQGPSLRLFPRTTPIIVPKGHDDRMTRDLHHMGFEKVIELRHGERIQLSPSLALTSYQFFFIPCDSALVFEGDDTVLLNANDTKLMGPPLDQVLSRHPKIDFVLRSHSSANSRLCYEYMDAQSRAPDDLGRYVRAFAQFAQRTQSRYAVPFASNHCHLHREVFHLNDKIQTPERVAQYFEQAGIETPKLKIMVSGDQFSSEAGFRLRDDCPFQDRDEKLRAYQAQVSDKLRRFYRLEARADFHPRYTQRFFDAFFHAVPAPLRAHYRGHPILWVLRAGEREIRLIMDIKNQRLQRDDEVAVDNFDMQIHTSAYIFRHAMACELLSHLPISKRVRYRTTLAAEKRLKLFNRLVNLYEYGVLPAARMRSPRFLESARDRWRELLLYGALGRDVLLGRGVRESAYLGPDAGRALLGIG